MESNSFFFNPSASHGNIMFFFRNLNPVVQVVRLNSRRGRNKIDDEQGGNIKAKALL
ncbi:hypothetical protein AtNW77_Chr3g0164951 [Arabidopsis thaliana]|uniref:Uncharacterized protein n=1 Tax=Arabidopsis thaliana TaxID=3702 RepID=A0A5S9XAH9_ARATH|nr:unnamed protein product [Arabidopsis thaliana]